MRNPSLQAINRMRELVPLLTYYTNELRNKRFEKLDAEEKLNKITKELATLNRGFNHINSLIARLAEGGTGLFPWGLPKTICISEFKQMVPDADIPDNDLKTESEVPGVDFDSGHSPTCGIRVKHDAAGCTCGY
jgi:hypothetical protein